MFDVFKIKRDFPLLKRHIKGKPIIYLDSTASSLKPTQVIDALNDYYRRYSVNIFRGIYTLSEEATRGYEESREKVASFINASESREIVFVRSATEAINLVMYSWGMKLIGKGDEVISTVMEHHANIVPWQILAQKKGAKLKYIAIDKEGLLKIDALEKLITKKTKLVAITYVSNVLGTINPVKQIVKTVKRLNPKTKVLIDGAQAIPHMKVDVKEIGCDFFAFSGHKMLGPTGIGVLWGKWDVLQTMSPYQYGGEMIETVRLDRAEFRSPPYIFEAGTPHIAGAIGLAKAIEYLEDIGMESVRNHEKELVKYAISRLDDLGCLDIYGPADFQKKGGVVAFNMKGVHPHDIAQVLDEDNICIRSGYHCAMPLHLFLGLNFSCRASFYIYNTKKDINLLINGLKKAKKIFT